MRYRFGTRSRRSGASYHLSTSDNSALLAAPALPNPTASAAPPPPESQPTPTDAPPVTLTGATLEHEGAREGWFQGVELEASMTAWVMAISERRDDGDDWAGVTSRVQYRIDPTAFYRARLTLLTAYADIVAQYELHSGLNLGGGSGSLLDLALAAPALIPALAPLSLRYQRLRFEEGRVDLTVDGLPTERQTFRTQLDEAEVRWQVMDQEQAGIWVTGRYRESATPRQIYLTEAITSDSSAHYDISDQLLWVPTTTLELGLIASVSQSEALDVTFGIGLGGGSYELRTPLEGALLDQGSLMSLSFQLGVSLTVPLSELLALKVAYDLRGQVLSPLGLPKELERELREDPTVGLSDLSLGFNTIDLLNRFWLSLALTL